MSQYLNHSIHLFFYPFQFTFVYLPQLYYVYPIFFFPIYHTYTVFIDLGGCQLYKMFSHLWEHYPNKQGTHYWNS